MLIFKQSISQTINSNRGEHYAVLIFDLKENV